MDDQDVEIRQWVEYGARVLHRPTRRGFIARSGESPEAALAEARAGLQADLEYERQRAAPPPLPETPT